MVADEVPSAAAIYGLSRDRSAKPFVAPVSLRESVYSRRRYCVAGGLRDLTLGPEGTRQEVPAQRLVRRSGKDSPIIVPNAQAGCFLFIKYFR